MRTLGSCCILISLLGSNVSADDPLPQFNRDIRPILSENCFPCHGQDSQTRKSDLRLDMRPSAVAAGAINSDDPAESSLLARIRSDDPEQRMPPPHSNRQLAPEQVQLLERWISAGAEYQSHWSFVVPVRPPEPKVEQSEWVRNPVDSFVLAKLESLKLAPSPEADRITLIRRLSLDLTGLPPTVPEVDAFLANQSSDAYEKVVDRLLNSKHYGERMAQPWLDAARYADTNGYQNDGERSMWRWRDWVIEAFNRNLPFDQFTIEQLAGDLLPDATPQQRLATGFNRNHRGNGEGGIVPEEYAVEYVVDRVDTTATVWMGLTMGCARCHDHKYDPLTQQDFYRMFAFFNNVPESGRAFKFGNSPPVMIAPTDDQKHKLEEIERQLKAAELRLLELEPNLQAGQATWERTLRSSSSADWSITRSLLARLDLAGEQAGGSQKFENGDPTYVKDRNRQVAVLDGQRTINAGDIGDFGFYDKFTLAAWIKPAIPDGAILSRMVDQSAESGFASDSEGYRVYWKAGRVQLHLTKRWLDDALRVETEAAFPVQQWHHVAVVYDGSRLASGVKIFINGQPQKLRVLLDQLNQSFQTKQPLRIGAGGGPQDRFQGLVSDVRVYGRALTDEDISIVATEENLGQLAAIAATERTPSQSNKLRECFLAEHAELPLREAKANVQRLQDDRTVLLDAMPTAMVMEELPVPRESFVLIRGAYDRIGERVSPGVPASIAPFAAGARPNRLDFAKWLVSPENPLTARVAVNYQWQLIFGTGLVKTAEDFGSQGEPPSHPELLDWLACEFMQTGWDTKALLKTVVMSATYRQASRVTPDLLERDPENRLLARGSRVRLSAEVIRDQALAVSGLLVDQVGGPSVKPYQPKGLWKDLSGTDYVPDHGDNLWRRSLYTFWKRTSPQPTMMSFDASAREMCRVRPARTSTPLQALALMNDVTFVESARGLAERAISEGGENASGRISLAFRKVLARPPRPEELTLLINNLNANLAKYRGDPDAALALISQGESPRDKRITDSELAAYTAIAGLILNLDEAITKP